MCLDEPSTLRCTRSRIEPQASRPLADGRRSDRRPTPPRAGRRCKTPPRRGALRRDWARPISPEHRYGEVAIVEVGLIAPGAVTTLKRVVVLITAVVIIPAAVTTVARVAGGEDARDPHTSPFCSFPGTSLPRMTSPSQPL